ncbi:MAG TPA: class I SAM-dependent methyltransferase [Anaerolineae bacterium]|nr:class I SAM-dependent methyltransferase [Anaerolineae bacterium]
MDSRRDAWKRYLTDYDEGLGLVYERFVLNDFLLALRAEHGIDPALRSWAVLEAPLYGMAGVSGINSVALAQAGAEVTLVDDHAERLAGVERIWGELGLPARFVHHADWAHLPFADGAFDLAWNWAALWHLPGGTPGSADLPAALLRELARVSRRLVFVAMPNRVQVGYLLRKYVLERDFVNYVDEAWADIGRVRRALESAGVRIVRQGVLDVPPWPDTVMPASEVLARLGIRSKKLEGQFSGDAWRWSTMDYYLGRQPDLYDRVKRYAWLDSAPIPWRLKAVWAHHRYVIGVKAGALD